MQQKNETELSVSGKSGGVKSQLREVYRQVCRHKDIACCCRTSCPIRVSSLDASLHHIPSLYIKCALFTTPYPFILLMRVDSGEICCMYGVSVLNTQCCWASIFHVENNFSDGNTVYGSPVPSISQPNVRQRTNGHLVTRSCFHVNSNIGSSFAAARDMSDVWEHVPTYRASLATWSPLSRWGQAAPISRLLSEMPPHTVLPVISECQSGFWNNRPRRTLEPRWF